MARTDVVIEVVDARLPGASSNPMIDELRNHRQRPCLKLLNKSDLADPAATQAWLEYFGTQPGVRAVSISCKNLSDVASVPKLCQQLAPHRSDATKPLRMMIMGIPNVGKSTLMNALLKRKVAAVGNEPAVTKMQQRMDISPSLSLVDTPGLLWPKITYESDGYMLAASHAVGVNAVAEEEVATRLGDILLARYPARLVERYGIELSGLDGFGVVEAVARRRGCVGRGGVLDLEKAALILLGDYRAGKLGPISLETPQSRAEMIARATAEALEATENVDEVAAGTAR